MIKFFRKIRQKILTENKLSKPASLASRYLLYSIGEIFLVVIGILIAVQINNWNEKKKIDIEEKLFLSGLIIDIEQDISNLKNAAKRDSIAIVANRILLDAFKHDSIRKNKEFLIYHMNYSVLPAFFNASITTFNQMESSSKVNYIGKNSVSGKIQEYYHNVERSAGVYRLNSEAISNYNNALIHYVDVNSLFHKVLPEYAQSELDGFDNSFFYQPIASPKVKEFANLVTARQLSIVAIDNNFNRLLEDAIQLKQTLIEYLNTKS